jgi:hypothetical protein
MSFKEDYYSYAEILIEPEQPWEVVSHSKRKNSRTNSDSESIVSQTKPIIVQPFLPSANLVVQNNLQVQPNKPQVQPNKPQVKPPLKQVIENKRNSPNSKPPLKPVNQKSKINNSLPFFQNENISINENWRNLENQNIVKPIPIRNVTEQKVEQLRQEDFEHLKYQEAELLKQKWAAEQLRLQEQAEQLRLQEQAEQLRLQEQAEQLRLQEQAEQLRLKEQAEQLKLQEQAEQLKEFKRNEELIRQKQIVDLIWENDAILQEQIKQENLRQEQVRQEHLRQEHIRQEAEYLRQEAEHNAILSKYPLNINQLNELTYSLSLPSIESLIEFGNNDIKYMVSLVEQKKIDGLSSEKVNVIIHYLIDIFKSGGLDKSILGRNKTLIQLSQQSYQPPHRKYQPPHQRYQQSAQRYQQPAQGYQQPAQGYQQSAQGYQQSAQGYQQSVERILTLSEIESSIGKRL